LCFLIPGALIQPRAPTSGRWLMWVGAVLLNVPMVPLIPEMVDEGPKILRSYPDSRLGAIYSLAVLSTVLLLWCDAALIMEAFKRKGGGWVRGNLDWVAWISAAVLSAWCIWISATDVRAYQRLGGLRIDLILYGVGMDAVVLLFDIALVLLAIKSAREAPRPKTR
jgi:hypothetical protein